MPNGANPNYVEVSLDLYGFQGITHAEISARLGLEPDKVYVQEQPMNSRAPQRLSPANRWLLFGYPKEGPWPEFEQQIDRLLEQVSARWEAFEELAGYCEAVEVKCAVFMYVDSNASTPCVNLAQRHVTMLARLRAEFDVDLYLLDASASDE